MTPRPFPPADLLDVEAPLEMRPAPDLAEWLRAAFIADSSPLFNAEHEHLDMAAIGVLWTNGTYKKQGKVVYGQAEIPRPPAASNAWTKVRWAQQLREWFGDLPDFVLTFWAPGCADLDDASFCAVSEHELYHCGQAEDNFGAPRFHRDSGGPVWAVRGHDVEEHVGVVERYGAWSPALRRLVDAAKRPPQIALASISGVCGTCLARVA